MSILASRNLALIALVITLFGFVLQSLGAQAEQPSIEQGGFLIICAGILTWIVSRLSRWLIGPRRSHSAEPSEPS